MTIKKTDYWLHAKKQESIFLHREKEEAPLEEPVVPEDNSPEQPKQDSPIRIPTPLYPKPETTRVVNRPPDGFTTSSFL